MKFKKTIAALAVSAVAVTGLAGCASDART